MIIHKPNISEKEGYIHVSARIKLENTLVKVPKQLWYKVPKKNRKYLSSSSNGFLVALVQLAMHLEEDILVEGSVSPKLIRGLEDYQRIYHAWRPDIFKRIISIKSKQKKTTSNYDKVACSFSGGLDSTYTFYNHLPKYNNIKSDQLDSVLFIQSSIFSMDKPVYTKAAKKYKNIVSKHNIELLSIETNIGDFEVKSVKDWVVLTFGSSLVSCVLLYANAITKYFIPSSYDYANLEPCGSHPMTDFLLSTESLEIVHHGAGVNKVEKTKFISNIPETYSYLRPCWENSDMNCGKCGKCVRTMVALKLNNKLNKYKTFPHILKRKTVRKATLNDHNYSYAKENMKYAQIMGNKQIAADLQYAIFRSKYIMPIYQTAWRVSANLKRFFIYRVIIKNIKNG